MWNVETDLGAYVRPRIVAYQSEKTSKQIQIKNFNSLINNQFNLQIENYSGIITSFIIGKHSVTSFAVRTQAEINMLKQPYSLFQIGIKFGYFDSNNQFVLDNNIPEFFYYQYDLLSYSSIKEFESLSPGQLIETKKKKRLYYIVENNKRNKPNYFLYSSWTNHRIKALDVSNSRFVYLKPQSNFVCL